jgi:hypothetical protein
LAGLPYLPSKKSTLLELSLAYSFVGVGHEVQHIFDAEARVEVLVTVNFLKRGGRDRGRGREEKGEGEGRGGKRRERGEDKDEKKKTLKVKE